LDVEVLLEDERVIVECFAGIGPGEKGLADALQNLCVNSFHVLLSAFWQRTDPEQVMIEDWEVGRGQFRAYIGNLGTRGSDSVAAQIPADLFPAIESSIKKEPMDERPHWFRHFFADVNGEQTFESLYDNEEWAAGVESMKALPWVKSKGYYSVRHFLLLMPTDDA
jgi:hypothetical protein